MRCGWRAARAGRPTRPWPSTNGAVAARAPPGLRAARPGVERPRRAGARARHDGHGARGRPVGGRFGAGGAAVRQIEGLADNPAGAAIVTGLAGAVHRSRGELGPRARRSPRRGPRGPARADHRPHMLLALVRGLTLQHVTVIGRPRRAGRRLACRREPGRWPGASRAVAAQAFARAGLEGRARTLLADVAPVWPRRTPGRTRGGAWLRRRGGMGPDARAPAEAAARTGAGAGGGGRGGLLHGQLAAHARPPVRRARPLGRRRVGVRACARKNAQLGVLWLLSAITDHDEGVARRRAGEDGADRARSSARTSASRRSG